jgi:hypothetical protein
MTTIFEPTGRHTYGMCGTFHFCAAIPLGRILCNGCHGPRGNHDHDFELSGRCTTEVAGVEAVVTTIPETDGAPHLWDVRDVPFLRRRITTSESSAD